MPYSLAPGVRPFPRGVDAVQIGTDPPRCLVLHRAPRGAVLVLDALDGTAAAADVLARAEADPSLWRPVLSKLLAAGLLVPPDDVASSGPDDTSNPSAERDSLVCRFRPAEAHRAVQARRDALVVVRGAGSLASAVAALLAAAGVGHVHQQPDRALRAADRSRMRVPDAGRRAGARADPTSVERSAANEHAALLAANLRRASPTVRVYEPAPHHHPTLVVLAGDGWPDLAVAAALTRDLVPHLAVSAGRSRAVIGPTVLPGRSSCLSCAHQSRLDRDPHWPAVAREVRRGGQTASAVLTSVAACLAGQEALEYLDGLRIPTTVDGTLEWGVGARAARRRSWSAHPQCGCAGAGPGQR